jgi:hypothetical protein
MITSVQDILALTANSQLEDVDVDWFVDQQFIPLPTSRYLDVTDSFQGKIEQKNYCNKENYSCTLFFYNGKPFLVKDAYDDGSKYYWDEDSEIIDKQVALEFVKEILEVYKNFYLKLVEEDF